jgi:hypothetical protein
VKVLDGLRAGVQARRKLRGANNSSHNATLPASNGANGHTDFNDLSSLRVGQNSL